MIVLPPSRARVVNWLPLCAEDWRCERVRRERELALEELALLDERSQGISILVFSRGYEVFEGNARPDRREIAE